MFEKAMEALGGIQRFVKSSQRILEKPNIGWDAPPLRATNTCPKFNRHSIKFQPG
jgi:uncharacterized protein (DUF362 family)